MCIEGWDEGIALLRGDKARFVIPSHLGYGSRGAGEHSTKRHFDFRRRINGR
jgi:FKBP-type peptidyl-prolyl cis-trans isomerase